MANGTNGKGWWIQLIPLGVAVAGGIWTMAGMGSDIDHLQDDFITHGTKPAHGTVGERLTEHDTKFTAQRDWNMGYSRSLESVNRANERLSNRIYNLQVENSQIKQRLGILENSLGSGK